MKKNKQEQEIAEILRDNLSFGPSGALDLTIASRKLISREHYAHMRGFILGAVLVLAVGIVFEGTKWLNDQPAVTPSLQDPETQMNDTLILNHSQIPDSL